MQRGRKSETADPGKQAAITLQGSEYWRAEFLRDFKTLTHRTRPDRVFSDFVEMTACAISNSVDLRQAPGREARYLTLINSYAEREDRVLFPKLFTSLTMALDAEMHDALGSIWARLELGDGWKGQFFTPYHISQMMAKMALFDVQEVIDKQGFITACEPACGPGGMIVAMAHALHDLDINYQQKLHVQGVDIDARCVHMAYIQASLLGIPAIITVGNSLSAVMTEHWYTPMHVMGGWSAKLADHWALEDARKLMLDAPAAPLLVLDPAAIGPELAEAAE